MIGLCCSTVGLRTPGTPPAAIGLSFASIMAGAKGGLVLPGTEHTRLFVERSETPTTPTLVNGGSTAGRVGSAHDLVTGQYWRAYPSDTNRPIWVRSDGRDFLARNASNPAVLDLSGQTITGAELYVALAFVPRTAINWERVLGCHKLHPSTDDNNIDTACSLFRVGTTTTWRFLRRNAWADFTLPAHTPGVMEAIIRPTSISARVNGGASVTTPHAAKAGMEITHVRLGASIGVNLAAGSPTGVDRTAFLVREGIPSSDERAFIRKRFAALVGATLHDDP